MHNVAHPTKSTQPNHAGPTPPASARLRVVRHIPDPMPQTPQAQTQPATGRTRPPAQAAQLISRMSHPERAAIHADAAAAGLSTTAYLLNLARRASPRVTAAASSVPRQRKAAPRAGDGRPRSTRTRAQSPRD